MTPFGDIPLLAPRRSCGCAHIRTFADEQIPAHNACVLSHRTPEAAMVLLLPAPPPIRRQQCLAVEPGYQTFPGRCARQWGHDGDHKSSASLVRSVDESMRNLVDWWPAGDES